LARKICLKPLHWLYEEQNGSGEEETNEKEEQWSGLDVESSLRDMLNIVLIKHQKGTLRYSLPRYFSDTIPNNAT
jgi:hypothetical protein